MSEKLSQLLDTHSSKEFFSAYRDRQIEVPVNDLCGAITHYLDKGVHVLEETPEVHLLAAIQGGGIKVESLKSLQEVLRSKNTIENIDRVGVPAISNSHMRLAWGVGYALAALTPNNQEES